MSDLCAVHRPYLAALADGELDLVPAATREHVEGCDACGRELATHRLLGSRLREAVTRTPARRSLQIPLAAAAAVLLVALGAHLATGSGPDPLATAVTVASRQPAYMSSSPSELAAWCTHSYGNRVPAVAVPGLEPIGARMDWQGGIGVATVTYSLNGKPVHISWLSRSVGGAAPSEVTVNGEDAVVVRAHGITAVVTGSTSEQELVAIAREVAAAE